MADWAHEMRGSVAEQPFRRLWGEGDPVIALHPLGLDSASYEPMAGVLAAAGLQTIAVDLPGFGGTPAPAGPLRPAALAAPVIELARTLRRKPMVIGISMGGRTALEAALTAPDAFRGVVAIAPALPWLRFRPLLQAMRAVDPDVARWLPLERVWPLLRWAAGVLETAPVLRDDDLGRAGTRLVYQLSCPAIRRSLLSAARELALDPAYGPRGFWTRLRSLRVPAAFVWGEKDMLVTPGFAHQVATARPDVQQVLFRCLGHGLNGRHHRCLAEAIAPLLQRLGTTATPGGATRRIGRAVLACGQCVVHQGRRPLPAVARAV